MSEKITEYSLLAQALRDLIYKLEQKYGKKFSQRQVAIEAKVSPDNFKSWINSCKRVNIHPENIQSLIRFFYKEGLFTKDAEYKEMILLWQTANQKITPDEPFIRGLLQQPQNRENILLGDVELDAEIYSPIHILTQYLPDAVRQSVENFLDSYLVGTKDQPALFGGRGEDLVSLNDWLNNPQPRPPYLLLYAPTGRGKSALLAHWASQLVSRQDLAVIFLPISLRFGTDYENFILRALAGSLASLHGDTNIEPFIYKSPPDELKARITRELKKPLPDKRQLVIILDGVDEAKEWEFNRANLFPNKPIPGLHIIISTRTYVDETESQDLLERVGWSPGLAQATELGLLFEAGIADLLTQEKLPLIQPSTGESVAKILYTLSKGEPLLVYFYVKELLDPESRFSIDQIHLFEPGLKYFFKHLWEEQEKQWGQQASQYRQLVHVILTILAHMLGPLDHNSLLRLLPSGIPDDTGFVEEALHALRRIVIGNGSQLSGYVFSHSKLREYELDRLLKRNPLIQGEMRKRILERCNMVITQLNKGELLPEHAPSYIVQFYRKHLEEANEPIQRFLPLLSEGWKRAWDVKGGLDAGFFDDIQAIWDKARVENKRLVMQDEHALYLATEFQCALCLGSRNSLVENVSPTLLAECVEKKILRLEEATVTLAQYYPPGMEKNRRLREVLMMAQNERDVRVRSEILIKLAPQLSSSPLCFAALKIAQTTPVNGKRSEAIVRIATRLPEARKIAALHEVLEEKKYFHTSQGDEFKSGHVQAVAALVPHLNDARQREAILKEAWEIALDIGNDNLRMPGLMALAAHLPADFIQAAIKQVKNRRRAINDWTWALASIVSFLPSSQQNKEDVVQETLNAVPSIKLAAERVRVVRTLLPSTTPAQRQYIITKIKDTIDDIRYKAEILIGLISIDPQEHLLQEAMQMTMEIQNGEYNGEYKVLILCDLLNHLQKRDAVAMEEKALASIDRINNEKKAALLLTLSSNVADEKRKRQLIEEARQITYSINDEHAQAQFLGKLAAGLPSLIRIGVLDKAREIAAKAQTESLRIKGMQAIIPSLPEAEQDQEIQNILETIEKHKYDQSKIDELEKLAPLLKPQHHDKVIEMAKQAQTPQKQAHMWVLLVSSLNEPMKSDYARKALSIIGTLGNKEEDQKYQADMFDLLVPYLPELLLQDARAIALAIQSNRYKVRALTALVPRLPETDIITEILNIMPTINFKTYDQRLPPHIFLTLAPYYQAESLIDEAFKWAEGIPKAYRPQVLLELLPHMIDKKDSKLEDKLEEALKIACELDEQYRAPALAQLAPHLVNILKIDRLYGIWSETIQLLAAQKRNKLLESETHLVPVMLALAGSEAGNSICNAVITVGQWW